MVRNLYLKENIDPDSTMDLGDTARTKLTLKALGYLDTPEHQLSQYPDQDMFDGLKRFQAAHDLQVDGIMKRGGPTERSLGRQLTEAGIFHSKPSVQNPAKPCPPGEHPELQRICIPGTSICIDKWVCIPNPTDGGERG